MGGFSQKRARFPHPSSLPRNNSWLRSWMQSICDGVKKWWMIARWLAARSSTIEFIANSTTEQIFSAYVTQPAYYQNIL